MSTIIIGGGGHEAIKKLHDASVAGTLKPEQIQAANELIELLVKLAASCD